MGVLIGFVMMTIFLLGLYQWAKGGASLWHIFRLRRDEKKLSREERAQAENEIKRLEQSADRTITASFRIIAILAVIVWFVFGVTIILEMFGINWMSYVASTAKAYWANPATQTSQTMTQQRNDMLRNMGNSLRR